MFITQACLQKLVSLGTTYSSELSDNQDKNVIGTFLLQVGQLRKFGVESTHCFDKEELLRLCQPGEKKETLLLNYVTSEEEREVFHSPNSCSSLKVKRAEAQ